MPWLKKTYSKCKAYLHTLRKKSNDSRLPGSRHLLNKNLFFLFLKVNEMNPGTTLTTDLHRQISTLMGQLGESKDSVFLYYKFNFLLRILDDKQLHFWKAWRKRKQYGHILDCFTPSWPPAITTSTNGLSKCLGSGEDRPSQSENGTPLVKHEKESQKYPGTLNKRKINKNSGEDLFLQNTFSMKSHFLLHS